MNDAKTKTNGGNTGTKTIKVDYLARVEGEGAMSLKIHNDQVQEVKLKIFEPPRFFEAFLRGRKLTDAPDITARICGICPVAYQMSSVHALERALGMTMPPEIRTLRRLLYCGEWIESHVLHIFMLHAPDFLGYQDAIQMAKDHKQLVETALRLKKIGNRVVQVVGGREIHPINVRVGGFYKNPPRDDLSGMVNDLKWAYQATLDAARVVATFHFPDFERAYEFVALSHPDEYPFSEGDIVSTKGLRIDAEDYEQHFEEIHVEHSNALQAVHKGYGSYFVGPLARFNLNFDKLPDELKQLSRQIGIDGFCSNPFKSILVRMVETAYAFGEALRIIQNYQEPPKPHLPLTFKAGSGAAATEAPRGLLWHRYHVNGEGLIEKAVIVPPTSQNQKTIEEDLAAFVAPRTRLPEDQLTWQCEQAIRNYDPCISCATHFLNLKLERTRDDEGAGS